MKSKDKRKLFGQHLLINEKSVQFIIDYFFNEIENNPVQNILEIGPGLGALTYPVIKKLKENETLTLPFKIIEKDYQFIDHWKNEKIDCDFQIIENDFLNLKEEDYLTFESTAILSNLPYSVGTRILTTLSYFPHKIPFMLVMLQKEVAERISAVTHTKSFGSLSIWMQNHWDVKNVLDVPPSHFNPPPQVDSQVIFLKARPTPLIPHTYPTLENLKLFERFLKNAFSQKRKMIRGAFKADSNLFKALESTQIDPTLRAETLSMDQWSELFQEYLILNTHKDLLEK